MTEITNDIEKLKIECAVAQNLLLNAQNLYYRALNACKQASDQLMNARRDFDAARNRLLSEIACGEIQSYLKDLDKTNTPQ